MEDTREDPALIEFIERMEGTMRAAIADMRGEVAGAGDDDDEGGRLEARSETRSENGDR